MSLFKEFLIRVIIIVPLTGILEFYAISRKHLVITPTLVIAIIVVTLIPLVANIWYSLHRIGIEEKLEILVPISSIVIPSSLLTYI